MLVGEYVEACGSSLEGINPFKPSFFPSAIAGSVLDHRNYSNLDSNLEHTKLLHKYKKEYKKAMERRKARSS